MAVVFLIEVIFVFCCIPWEAGIKENVRSISEQFIAMPHSDIQCSELVTVAMIITCAMFVFYQLCSIWHQDREQRSFAESLNSIRSKVNSVTSFYNETEAMFQRLENKSKIAHLRYSKLKGNKQDSTSYGSLMEEIAFYKRSWEDEFQAFRSFGIEDFKVITGTGIQAQLTMAKAFTEKELRRIESHSAEDKLSLEEVKCDVRRLQKYFGRRSRG